MRHTPIDPTSGHTQRDADNLRERGINPADVAARDRGTICPLCPITPGRVVEDVWHLAGRCDTHWQPPVPARTGHDLITTEHLVALLLRNIAETGQVNYLHETLCEYADQLDRLAIQRLHGPVMA